jgi:hypothetical protein
MADNDKAKLEEPTTMQEPALETRPVKPDAERKILEGGYAGKPPLNLQPHVPGPKTPTAQASTEKPTATSEPPHQETLQE